MSSIRILGKISPGHGVASGKSGDSRYPGGTLKQQLPYFKEKGLDLSSYYLGTINLDIAPYEIQRGRPKYFLTQIAWSPYIPAENFYFFDVTVYHAESFYTGLIYMPDPETKVEHEQKNTILELIVPEIPDLNYGDKIEIEVPTEQLRFIK